MLTSVSALSVCNVSRLSANVNGTEHARGLLQLCRSFIRCLPSNKVNSYISHMLVKPISTLIPPSTIHSHEPVLSAQPQHTFEADRHTTHDCTQAGRHRQRTSSEFIRRPRSYSLPRICQSQSNTVAATPQSPSSETSLPVALLICCCHAVSDMFGTTSSSTSSTVNTSNSSLSDTDYSSWSTATHDRHAPLSAYNAVAFQQSSDAAMYSHPYASHGPRAYEQTWFSVEPDLFHSHGAGHHMMSPVPLTSSVNSLYLPLSASLASHRSDESDSTTSSSSSPPPLPPLEDESQPPSRALYSFPPLPPATSAPPLALVTSRKRVKVDDHERAARAERKRHRHRAIDLARRQRETTAIQRLNQLITLPPPTDTTTTSTNANASDDKKDKVTILEHAVQQLAELQQLVTQLTYNNNTQHDQLNAARFQLHQTQNALTHLDDETRSHSIYSSAFLSSSLSLFLVSVGTGLVLDANARLFQSTGWQRHHVIGRLLTAPYQSMIYRNSTLHERMQRAKQRLLVENEHKQMVPAENVHQYESSRRALVELLTGQKEQIYAVWRMYIRNGKLCELPGTCWAGEEEDVEEVVGGQLKRCRRPKHITFAFAFSDAIMLD